MKINGINADTHELKTWPASYAEIAAGRRRHEVRKADRNFKVGDVVLLQEYDPSAKERITGDPPEGVGYTGREVWARITAITKPGEFGLPADLVVFSISNPIESGSRS